MHVIGVPSAKKKDICETILGALISSGFDSPKTKAWKVHISITPALSTKTCEDAVLPIALEILKASKQIDLLIQTGYGSLDTHCNIHSNTRSNAYAYLHSKHYPQHTIVAPQEILLNKYRIDNRHKIWRIRSLNDARKKRELCAETAQVKMGEDSNQNKDNVQLPTWLACSIVSGLHAFIWGANGVGKTSLSEQICSIRLPIDERLQESVVVKNYEWINAHGFYIPINRFSCAQETIKTMLSEEPVGCIQKNISGVVILDEFLHATHKDLNLLLDVMDEQKRGDNFVHIIAMTNSCPCGKLGSDKVCVCSKNTVYQYRNKMHEGLVDRFAVFKYIDQESKQDTLVSINNLGALWESFEKQHETRKQKIKTMLCMHGITPHSYSYRQIDHISRFVSALSLIQNTSITSSVINKALEYTAPPAWLRK